MMQQMMLGHGAAAGIDVDDVFAATAYTGNASSSRSINNGLDLDGEGGIVWIKSRNLTNDHVLHSTSWYAPGALTPNKQGDFISHGSVLTAYNNNGWTMGNNGLVNGYNDTYVAWSFRKASKFFDVVSYTGNGTAGRTVSHNLGTVPGMIWVKQTNGSSDWIVYHKGLGNTKFIRLNTNGAAQTFSVWNNTTPTATEFTVGSLGAINGSGNNFTAFLFADEDPIKCGSYVGNSSLNNGPTVNLGFEPQWVLIKAADVTGQNWNIFDSSRGFTSSAGQTDGKILRANSQNSESTGRTIITTSTGFQVMDASNELNSGQDSYVYMAIAAS